METLIRIYRILTKQVEKDAVDTTQISNDCNAKVIEIDSIQRVEKLYRAFNVTVNNITYYADFYVKRRDFNIADKEWIDKIDGSKLNSKDIL